MNSIRLVVFAIGSAAATLLSGCGGSGSGSGSGLSNSNAMFVETCSLGCDGGQGGTQVPCAIVNYAVNQDIYVYFSEAVDPTSLNGSSFKIQDQNSGSIPVGLRFVDALNPRKVIFRPSVTFASDGSATFSFVPGATYSVFIPGTAQGDAGPFIKSLGGKQNESRLQCQLLTTSTVTDLVPGAPIVSVKVDQAIPSTPNVNDTVPNVNAENAVDVWRNSTIRLTFNDLMNPATLAPGGISSFVTVAVDLDGDVGTSNDRVLMNGTWVVAQDTQLLQTTMVFTSAIGIPSRGSTNCAGGRKVVVFIPNNLRDIAGNQLGNPKTGLDIVAFCPENIPLAPTVLPTAGGETFTTTDRFDAARSSATWGSGKLTRGFGGGSGRLGELVVKPGQTVTLNTDSQSFPLTSQFGRDILDNLEPGVDYFPGQPGLGPEVPPALVITDGIFEFSSIRIATGGTVLITGSKPARLLSRGPVNIQGLLDVSGRSPGTWDSLQAAGQAGGAGGPSAGSGGKGATRADITVPGLLTLNSGPNAALFNAVNFDENVIPPDPNGSPGGGVGNVGTLAAGGGGIGNPSATPLSIDTGVNLGDVTFSSVGGSCISHQVASPGGGGAYATDGAAAVPATPSATSIQPVTTSNLPSTIASGGLANVLNIEAPTAPPVVRLLDPLFGSLRGGAGGGGGGRSLFGTDSSGFPPNFCVGVGTNIQGFRDHSAAAGGGGGGALSLTAGSSVTVSGLIDAGGGDGGSGAPQNGASTETRFRGASPGGGGSGGAVRIQCTLLDLTGTTQARIDVGGGTGGSNYLNNRGGNGGAGLIRLEASLEALTRAAEAPHIAPTDALVVGTDAQNVLSVGNFVLPRRRPDCFTGGVSCWLRPSGNFFQIQFIDDSLGTNGQDLTPGGDDVFAWNMDLRYDTGSGEQLIKFRGADANLPFTPTVGTPDFQAFLGNTLNYGVPSGTGSYLSVRFQGVQLLGALSDSQLCNISLDPIDGQALLGSLTPWVRHPADLNVFNPRPNAIRFCVVFDTSLALPPNSLPSFIKGVTNLKISAQPD